MTEAGSGALAAPGSPGLTLSVRWRLARIFAWAATLAVGASLRLSHLELTEFGIDAQTAVQMGRAIRLGWEYPLAGPRLGVSSQAGPVEFYLMAIPQLVSDSPEAAAAFVGLLALVAGLVFAVVVYRHLGHVVALAAFALYATGPWAVYFARKVWTPDTLPFFSALVFALLVLSLAERRRFALPLALFILGFEVQLHLAAIVLLPAVALIVLIFTRRVRPLELGFGVLAFFAALGPYLYHGSGSNFEDLRLLLLAGGQTPAVDLLSFDVLQTLVAGAEFPIAVGLAFPPAAPVLSLPAVSWGLVLAFWGGVALALARVIRAWRGKSLGAGEVLLVVALIWTLLPPLVNVRHSVPVYFRYQLYLLPVAFLFPALGLKAIATAARRAVYRMAAAGDREAAMVGAAVLGVLLTVAALWGAVSVESVNRTILDRGYNLVEGTKDVYSGPPVLESRLALSRLEAFVRPDQESIIVGEVHRGPLEYLANSRYRLRFSDEARVLIIPSHEATLAILPESAAVAEAARAFGAAERTDVDLRWPPDDRRAAVFEVSPTAVSLPAGFVRMEQSQILANGLELVGYAVEDLGATEFDLTLVWRVANEEWAHKFWLYNSYVNVYRLDGQPVAAQGEVELSTSSNWRQGDLLVVPTQVVLSEPPTRALYRLDAGVYVRFPPRVTISPKPGTVAVATLGPVALGKARASSATGEPLATFGETFRLVSATASLGQEASKVEVATEWEAIAPSERDFTIFVHLYDANGTLVAQADGPPVAGGYPTSHWLVDELVRDERAIALPSDLEEGRYTVKVGLYDSATLERLLPVPDHGDGAVLGGYVEIRISSATRAAHARFRFAGDKATRSGRRGASLFADNRLNKGRGSTCWASGGWHSR